jgi:thymidylate synthase
MEIEAKNVNHAFSAVVHGIASGDIPTTASPSRYGPVWVITRPLTITYLNPLDRVLSNEGRDVNHFFYLFEALWMLAGRNDVEPLAYYANKMREFSDNGKTFNGAYGYRWRHANGHSEEHDTGIGIMSEWKTTDQLALIINELKQRPESRRCVLQMWGVEGDLLKIAPSVCKDVCCNLCIMFLINPATKCLDMTVINRSNDLIWGTLGANVVHMSFLLEYMAACIGVQVGVYHQISNNAHVYDATFTPDKWQPLEDTTVYDLPMGRWHIPLVKNPVTFDRECKEFVETWGKDGSRNWKEPFLQHVASPFCWAFYLHKQRNYPLALAAIENVAADDWRIAGKGWIERRRDAWEKKQSGATVDG